MTLGMELPTNLPHRRSLSSLNYDHPEESSLHRRESMYLRKCESNRYRGRVIYLLSLTPRTVKYLSAEANDIITSSRDAITINNRPVDMGERPTKSEIISEPAP